jgi:uncharacterized Zn-binding protein involved in type VI secretion
MNVFIEKMPAMRIGMDMHQCPMVFILVPHMPAPMPIIPAGPRMTFINKMPAARTGDLLTCVSPAPNMVSKGASTVFVA